MEYGYTCGEDFWDCGCCKSCWPDGSCYDYPENEDEL